jgi:hypothetical protein
MNGNHNHNKVLGEQTRLISSAQLFSFLFSSSPLISRQLLFEERPSTGNSDTYNRLGGVSQGLHCVASSQMICGPKSKNISSETAEDVIDPFDQSFGLENNDSRQYKTPNYLTSRQSEQRTQPLRVWSAKAADI